MALDLKDRPGSQYDDGPSPLGTDKGIQDAENFASDPTNSSQSIAQRELNATNTDGNNTAKSDSEPIAEDSGIKNSTTSEPTPKSFVGKLQQKRKQVMAAIGAIGVTTALAGGVIAGPSLMLNYVSNLINGKVGELQNQQMTIYRRTKLSKISDAFSRDGRKTGPIITELQRSGYKVSFDPNDRNKILGVTTPDGRSFPASTGAAGDEIARYMDKRHPIRSTKWKNERMDAFLVRNKVSRTGITSNPATGPPADPEVATNKELNNRANGIDTRSDASVRISNADNAEDLTQEQLDELSNADELGRNTGELDELNKKLAAGVPRADLNDAERALLEATEQLRAGAIGTTALNAAEEAAKSGKFGVGSFLKNSTLSGTYANICTVRTRIRQGATAARLVAQAALMRYMFAYVTADDAQKKGEAASALTMQMAKRVMSSDSSGNFFGSSEGFKFASTGRFSKSKNEQQRGIAAVDGKITGNIKVLDDKINDVTTEATCNIARNPLTQIGEGVVTVVAGIFSGGAATAGARTATEVVKIPITQAVKTAISNGIIKTIGKEVVKQAALQVTFEGIMTLVQMYSQSKLTLNVTGQETGGMLSSMLVSGGGSASKQRSLAAGFVPATATQYAQAHDTFLANKKEELKDQPLFARFFDADNVDSLAFNTISKMPFSPEEGRVMALSSPSLINPSNVFTTFASTFTQKTYAADGDDVAYDDLEIKGTNYAADPYGNLLPVMRQDIANMDEEAVITELSTTTDSNGDYYINASTLEPISNVLKKHIENCVDNLDLISVMENGDSSKPEEDCAATQPLTVKFKVYLAYADLISGLEGPGEGTGAVSTPTAVTNTGASAEYIPDCSVNGGSAQIACVAIDTMLGIPYKNGYSEVPGCKVSPSTSTDPDPQQLDCSAFTAMAVYRAFGTNAPRTSTDYLKSPLFELVGDTRSGNIGNIRDIQPGDMIGKGTSGNSSGGGGHIGIVVSYDPITKKLVTAETDSCRNESRIVTTKSLEIDGLGGTYSWAVRYIGPKNGAQP